MEDEKKYIYIVTILYPDPSQDNGIKRTVLPFDTQENAETFYHLITQGMNEEGKKAVRFKFDRHEILNANSLVHTVNVMAKIHMLNDMESDEKINDLLKDT